MLWIRVASDIADSPKCGILAQELGVTRDEALARMIALWGWAARHASDGNLGGKCPRTGRGRVRTIPPAEIAQGAKWTGEPERFMEALRAAELLDGDSLHGWEEMNGRALREAKRKASARRASADAGADGARTGRGHDRGQSAPASDPNVTLRSPPNNKKQPRAVSVHTKPEGPNDSNGQKPVNAGEVLRKNLPAALIRGASMAKVSPYTVGRLASEQGFADTAGLLAWLYVTSRDVRVRENTNSHGPKIDFPDAWYTALVRSGKTPPDTDYAEAKRVLRMESDETVLSPRHQSLLADLVKQLEGGKAT